MFSQWRHRTLKNNEFFWILSFFGSTVSNQEPIKWALVSNIFFQIGCQWKNRPCFKITQVRSSCLWYGRAAREDTTSRILSTGIVVQGTWLMQRSIWLFFHFCWLQITVLKVSSIIIPAQLAKQSSYEQPISLARCFSLRNWELITQRSCNVYNGNHFVH